MREVKRGDVFFYYSEADGSVQGGERPCVIVSNNSYNLYSTTVTIAPITTAEKKKLVTHVPIRIEKMSTVLCEQVTTISREKLIKRIGHIVNMTNIDYALKAALGLRIY